jgi:hypothetical protein
MGAGIFGRSTGRGIERPPKEDRVVDWNSALEPDGWDARD